MARAQTPPQPPVTPSDAPTATVFPPVRGEWVALNTPAERIPSHGTDFFGRRYAFDLVQFDAQRQSFSGRPLWQQFFGWVRADQFLCWGQPTLACFDAEVFAAADGWPDRMRVNALWQTLRAHGFARDPGDHDLRPLLGNHLILCGAAGCALYAHLQKGSICVQAGQRVRAGPPLASVGNSGNSTQPHLHFQLMDRPSLRDAQGIYGSFLNCHLPGTAEPPKPEGLVPPLMQPFVAR